MRCFACSSTNHLLRDCPVSNRPAEVRVEFDSVYDIDDRVRSLNNFAIFRTEHGECNEHTLRRVVNEHFWRYGWQGNVIPISNRSFLVGFVNEFGRDQAVREGRMEFSQFSGRFYAWDENLGTSKVSRPVFLWLKLVGLPLQCWGEDEINKLVSSFGKLLQISENFYLKSSADVVRVMVEVEDISVIPKVVQCTYKAVSDDAYRAFDVCLVPSCQCLPYSQLNQENYTHLAQTGGMTDTVEESLSAGSSVGGRGLTREVERMVGEEEPPEVTDMPHAFREEASTAEVAGFQISGEIHGRSQQLSPAKIELRRKGKGPMETEFEESNWANNELRAHHSRPATPAEGLDAALIVGTGHGPLSVHLSQENVKGKNIPSQGELVGAVTNLEGMMEGVRLVGEEIESQGMLRRRKCNSVAGRPSFQRIVKAKSTTVSVPATPFGVFQKGGFKHLKRPASATSATNSGTFGKKKKGSPHWQEKYTASG